MDCLSVRQPWADAIVLGHKTVENRAGGFTKKFRGRLYIASSMSWSRRGQNDQRMIDAFDGCDPESNPLRRGGSWSGLFIGGAILGHVEVVDIHFAMGGCCQPWGESEYLEPDGRLRTGLTHILMEDAEVLDEPIPAKGRLGIWKYHP